MALKCASSSTACTLQSKGFTAEQAEDIAEQMNQLLIQDIATKGDLANLRGEMASLRTELKGDIRALRTELKGDIAAVRTEMKAMGSELTVKMYGVGLAVVALVVTAQKLLP